MLGGLGICVPLDKGLPYEELETSLARSAAEVLIFDPAHQEQVERLRAAQTTKVSEFICMDESEDYVSVAQLRNEGRQADAEAIARYQTLPIDAKELSLILFTSGTTSMAKAVMLSQYNIVENVYALQLCEDIRRGDINMAFLPYHHTFGATGQLVMLAAGAATAYCDGLKYLQKNIVEYRISVFFCVPLLIEGIYKRIMLTVKKEGLERKVRFGLKLSGLLLKCGIDVRRKIFKQILDQLGGSLRLGISGAAYATILAQVLALCYQLRLLSDKRELIHFRRGTYRLHSQIVKSIISIGISPFSMNVCSCIIVIFINNQLVHYGGDLSVGAYGISNKILFIFVMFVIGLNQGMQPIAGYNYGAQKFDRLMHVVKLTMLSATAVMTVGWCLAIFMPRLCVRLFTTDATLISISANALRIMCCMFPIVGYQMVVTNFFQCIGKVKVSIFLSLSRQLIFLLPMLGLRPHLLQLNGVWFSMPASDLLASLVTAWIMARYMRKFMRQQQEKEIA